jgi:hypothetical protein
MGGAWAEIAQQNRTLSAGRRRRTGRISIKKHQETNQVERTG